MISSDVSAQSGRENEGAAAGEEQWFVATSAGIRPMTTDAIEQAFERGALDANAQVWTSGMLTWESLGLIAELNDSPTHQGASSGARERVADTARPLGDKPLKSRRAEPFSYPPPLPGLSNLNESLLASVIPPPPASVGTLVRQHMAAVSSGKGARELGSRMFTWFLSRLTWQAWLFSGVAGTALGLFLYQNVVRGFWTGSESPLTAESTFESAPQTAQSSLLAADPNSAKRADVPEPEPVALEGLPIASASAPLQPSDLPEALVPEALAEDTEGLADAVDPPPSSAKRSAKAKARAKAQAKARSLARARAAKAKAKRAQTKRSKPAATGRNARSTPSKPAQAVAPYSRR